MTTAKVRSVMKKNSRVFKDSKTFLNDFFQSFGDLTQVYPTDYFSLFQKPVGFSDLLERCRPSAHAGVSLLDGQSRAGKTWTAVGIIRELLDQELVDAVWSSGEDSRFVYSGERTTVADGIRWVVDSLESFLATQQHEPLVRLTVLLDDFFGSARLKPLASDENEFLLVKECLTLDGDQNPILSSLTSHKNVQASLLMTGRSSIYSLAEIRLGVPLGARVRRIGRAFFERVSGKLVGEDTSEWLDHCLERHNEFVSEHSEFILPPMTAFSSNFPVAELYGSEIPDILFGGDLRAIMEELKNDAPLTEGLRGSLDPEAQTRLRRLLLIYVAPALVLPLPSIDSCLTGNDSPKKVRAVLSLQPEEHGDFALRVPNRYYLRAVQQELLQTESLTLVANSLIEHARGQEGRCGKQFHILSRGLIERGLESVDEALRQHDDDAREQAGEIRNALSERVNALPGADEEPLLQWEAALVLGSLESKSITDVVDRVPREPGLASAIGWGLYRFRRVMPLTDNRESVAIKRICSAFEESAKNLGENEDHHVLTVSYSNFIRWATQMEPTPAEQSPIHLLAGVSASVDAHSHAKGALKMVLEDALIWADSYQVEKGVQCVSVSNLASAHELWDALESEAGETAIATTRDESSITNHLFSLEWHNEWKERAGYRRKVLGKWLQSNQERALELIRQKPKLLDDNLAYHWSHMVTQWSVWARNWCFSSDPNAHEYQKELIGCRDQKNNLGIHTILKQAMDSAFKDGNPKHRLRNAFFLLAIRSGGPPYEELLEVHKHLGDAIHRASLAPDNIKSDLAQAIFELIRQGYVDRTEAGVLLQQSDDLKDQLPRGLGIQCVGFLKEHGSNEWEAYHKELESITCLDVLPQDEADLIPYGRFV